MIAHMHVFNLLAIPVNVFPLLPPLRTVALVQLLHDGCKAEQEHDGGGEGP